MPSTKTLAGYEVSCGVGLLITMWAFQTYLWYGYQRTNPDIETVSTTPGFKLFYAVLFVAGIVIAFTAFSRGLGHVLDTTT